ncbi:hypothetical protein Tco_1175819 [Tanacetum coccineum]
MNVVLIELENQVKVPLRKLKHAPKSYCSVNKSLLMIGARFVNGHPPNVISKLLSPKHQSQPSLGDEGRNSLYPKRVNFVNTITIIRKEGEEILRKANCLKLDSDCRCGKLESRHYILSTRHLDRNNENLVDKESKASEIVIDEEESSDLGINDDRGEVDKEKEWVEYKEPLDLVNTNEE